MGKGKWIKRVLGDPVNDVLLVLSHASDWRPVFMGSGQDPGQWQGLDGIDTSPRVSPGNRLSFVAVGGWKEVGRGER